MSLVNNGVNLLNHSLIRGAQPQVPAQQPRKPSEFWLNIGVNAGDEFISLPVGLPLDDMKPARTGSGKSDWQQMAQAKNLLLEQLQQLGAMMEPGTEQELTLTVRLRRTAQHIEPPADENPLAAAVMAALMGGK